jgi:ParB family chromosome partitioning protein
MSKDKSRLGKGLEAIFGENVSDLLDEIQRNGTNSSVDIDVTAILPNPYQPRVHFDETKISELAESIKQHGIFTPLLIRKAVSGYQLIAGERRLRAAKEAMLKTVPAIIVDFSDEQMMEVSLIENIQRENLNVVEEARAYSNLIDKLHLSQEAIAVKVGKSRPHIANTLRLLQLPNSVIEALLDNSLTMGQVKPLISLDDPKRIESLAQRIIKEKLSSREVEKLVKQKSNSPKPTTQSKHYTYPVNQLTKHLETKVEIIPHKISIYFDDEDDLNRILEKMGALEE